MKADLLRNVIGHVPMARTFITLIKVIKLLATHLSLLV